RQHTRAVAHHERVAGERAAVAAAQDRHRLSRLHQQLGDPRDDRRLSAAAEVADADDRTREPLSRQETAAVGLGPQRRDAAERAPQQAPHASSGASASAVRLTAPRLRPTRPRARSPSPRRRGSSSMSAPTSRPSSSAEATCTIALSERKASAISWKFSMCGPTSTGLPATAGSRMLWPPEGTRLPPTNTTLASA